MSLNLRWVKGFSIRRQQVKSRDKFGQEATSYRSCDVKKLTWLIFSWLLLTCILFFSLKLKGLALWIHICIGRNGSYHKIQTNDVGSLEGGYYMISANLRGWTMGLLSLSCSTYRGFVGYGLSRSDGSFSSALPKGGYIGWSQSGTWMIFVISLWLGW